MTARLWPGARSGDVVRALAVLLSTAFVAGLLSPYGRATDDVVTYEVVSDSVGIAGIEYMDAQRRMLIRDVPSPGGSIRQWPGSCTKRAPGGLETSSSGSELGERPNLVSGKAAVPEHFGHRQCDLLRGYAAHGLTDESDLRRRK